MMLFEVFNKHKQRVMHTEYKECIPDTDTLRIMETTADYTFKLDGKTVTSKTMNKNTSVVIENPKNKQTSKLFDIPDKFNAISDFTLNSRTVRCIETGTIFKTQALAAKEYSIDPAYVSESVRTGKPYKGYTFEKVMK